MGYMNAIEDKVCIIKYIHAGALKLLKHIPCGAENRNPYSFFFGENTGKTTTLCLSLF